MLSLVSRWVGFWGWEARAITVSRMQDKIVETPDGAIHTVLNAGRFNGLNLYTSTDNGLSWDKSYEFESSDLFSTAHLDMLEDGETLTVSYQGEDGAVLYKKLGYNPDGADWSALTDPVVVFEGDATARVSLPNHVMAVNGGLYSLSIGDARFVPEVNIAVSTDDGATWSPETFRLFGNDRASVRAVTTPEVSGVIVATDNDISWFDVTAPSEGLVEISGNGSFSVFASHYSVTVVGNDIFLANVTQADVPQVELFVYEGATRQWRELEVQNTFSSEAYVQISSNPQGHLYLTFDDFGDSTLRVLESLDGGLTWDIEAEIEVEESVFPALTRMNAPEYFTEDLVVFQMVQPREGSDFYGVSSVTVDVDGDGSVVQAIAERAEERIAPARDWELGEGLADRTGFFNAFVAEDSLL